jgi:predicted transcriptional regulator of viral defense system
MELHQMTTQPVNTVYVTVPKQRTNRTVANVAYRFIYANPRSFMISTAEVAKLAHRLGVGDRC